MAVKRLAVGTVVSLAIAGTAFAQSTVRSEIRDAAGLFGAEAIARAKGQIETLERRFAVPIVIETIETLRGQSIDDAAVQRARQEAGHGIYVLAARREHKIEVLLSSALTKRIPDTQRLAIRNVFVEGFKEGDFDAGLQHGVQRIGEVLAASGKSAANPPAAESPPAHQVPTTTTTNTTATAVAEFGSAGLLLRDQVRLTLPGARTILDGAEAKARELGLKMNIAVVDDGGHMIAFERMDGARPASAYTATTKAITAATFRAPSGPQPPGTAQPDPLLNISLQNAALASGGKITTLQGGVPVVVEGQVIGGVGVGGGSGEQDATVARAGIDALLAALKLQADRPKDEK
jgi:glc operon protein GlcG